MNLSHKILIGIQLLIITTSCNPVKFSSGTKKTNCQNPPCVLNTLSCSPVFEGGSNQLTILTTQTNPKIFSRCSPATGTNYTWTVFKNGNSVNVSNLTGAEPTGQFQSLGIGTYSIYLNASNSSHIYSTSSPLQLNINSSTNNTSISCTPRLNGNLTSITLTDSSANPQLTASCNPSGVSYNWTVRNNGNIVGVTGLTGANSTPDFKNLNNGTYQIYLDATGTGLTSYSNASSPLTVSVNKQTALPSITCAPKINSNLTQITLNQTNPTITANCNPSNVAYSWLVKKNNTDINISGLTGSSSTPDFIGSGSGTYTIYLTSTASGYSTYTTTQPLTVIVPQTNLRNVSYSKTVTTSDNQLDILVVIDDSNSMLADNQKLASRLKGFVDDLSSAGFDWQMCLTLTRAQQVSSTSTNLVWGASTNWVGNTNATQPWILKAGTNNIYNIFTNTISAIGAGWAGTDDERAIKAAWWHLWNGEPGVSGTSGCYRNDAGLAVIILSDEDERSIGGDSTQAYYSGEYKVLENDDLPQTYVNYVKQVFGANKRFSVNSIIVKPGDTTCMTNQDASGSKSHYGTKYNELSQLTQGFVGSICDTDYSQNLVYFKNFIVNSLNSVPLECSPYSNTVNSTVTPAMSYVGAISGLKYLFTPSIPVGRTISVNYQCSQ